MKYILLAVFLGVITLLLTGQAAAGQEGQGEHSHDYVLQSNEDAEIADLEAMAEGKGLSMDEAKARTRLTDVLGDLQEDILNNPWRARFFAGAEVRDDGTAAIYLKGDNASLVTSRLRGADVSGSIEIVTGQKYSLQELEERAMATHTELARLGFNNIVTAFDIRSGRVQAIASTLEFEGAARLTSASLAESGQVVLSALSADLRQDIDFRMIDESVGEDRAHAAVGGMEARDDGVFECTIGWSVEEVSGSRTGVTTAGHCNGINEARELPGYGLVDLAHVREHRGDWGDVEWKTTSGAERAQFLADENDNLRNVTAVETVGNMVVGESVCAFGQSSNDRECRMDIRRTSISCTNSGVRNDRLVQMDANLTLIGGDSGGGYSWNTRAYGSDKGACRDPDNGVFYAAFSAADRYDEAIGVRVMTQ